MGKQDRKLDEVPCFCVGCSARPTETKECGPLTEEMAKLLEEKEAQEELQMLTETIRENEEKLEEHQNLKQKMAILAGQDPGQDSAGAVRIKVNEFVSSNSREASTSQPKLSVSVSSCPLRCGWLPKNDRGEMFGSLADRRNADGS